MGVLSGVDWHFSDEDLAGDHLLAEVSVSLKKVLSQNQKKFQVPLEKPHFRSGIGLDQGLIVSANVGRIELSLAFYAKSGTLKVTIIQCVDLPQFEADGAVNPYVQV